MFLNKQDSKFLLRSRSWRFMRAARFGNTGPLASCHWKRHTLHYRPGGRELIYAPDKYNQGGFSFFQDGAPGDATRIRVATASPAGFMRERGLDGVDLIKIDTEGTEYEILTAFDSEVLRQVKWIIGELHGQRNFELLSYLSQWFDISLRKSFRKPLFIFAACNKNALEQLLA